MEGIRTMLCERFRVEKLVVHGRFLGVDFTLGIVAVPTTTMWTPKRGRVLRQRRHAGQTEKAGDGGLSMENGGHDRVVDGC
jgi:hypothetical protein